MNIVADTCQTTKYLQPIVSSYISSPLLIDMVLNLVSNLNTKSIAITAFFFLISKLLTYDFKMHDLDSKYFLSLLKSSLPSQKKMQEILDFPNALLNRTLSPLYPDNATALLFEPHSNDKVTRESLLMNFTSGTIVYL